MGLLSKAQNTSQENTGIESNTFSALCISNNYFHAGLFTCTENVFILTKAYGIDFKSVMLSLSTKSFWTGSIPLENKWFTFSLHNNNLNDFYQFFNKDIRQSIKAIHFYRTTNIENKSIVFFCAEYENENINPLLDENIKDKLQLFERFKNNETENLKKISLMNNKNKYLYKTNLKDATQKLIETAKFPVQNLVPVIFSTIEEELTEILHKFSDQNIFIKNEDFIYSIIVFTEEKYNEEFLKNHFYNFIKNIFTKECHDYISATCSLLDFTLTADNLKKYLQVN